MNIIGEVSMWGLDKIELENNERLYNAYLEDVGINDKIWIGVSIFKDDYEVFVDEAGRTKTEYFLSFEDALHYCKTIYPEAEWSNLG